jgi:hypothetical protein
MVGLWFLIRGNLASKWVAAFCLFSIFASINLIQAWEGATECGCLGTVKASPWFMFGVDLASLTILTYSRPSLDSIALKNELRDVVKHLMAPAIAGLVAGLFWLRYGSVDKAIAAIRGQSYSVEPELLDFGKAKASELRVVTVTVSNMSGEPLRIVGGQTDCSFVSIQDLPISVKAHDSSAIPVAIRFPIPAGRFTQRGKLFLGGRDLAAVHFQITGWTSPDGNPVE